MNDRRKEWEAAVGKALMHFADIEFLIENAITALRVELPEPLSKLKLERRRKILLLHLKNNNTNQSIILQESVRKIKALAKKRNLIAHNPLVLGFYESGEGAAISDDLIARVANVTRHGVFKSEDAMSFDDLEKLSNELEFFSDQLLKDLISFYKINFQLVT